MLCFLEDDIIEDAFQNYWLASRGVGRRTKIGDTMREIVAKAKAVLGRLESAADSGPAGMAQLVGDDEDLGGAAAVPFNAKSALMGFAEEIDEAAVRIEAVKGKVDRVIIDAVARTLPDKDRYVAHVAKYAHGKARSKVGNAVRRGAAAHDDDDDVDGDK